MLLGKPGASRCVEWEGDGGGKGGGKDGSVHICQVMKSGELTEHTGIENGRSGQLRLLLGLIWGGELGGSQAGICSEGRG